MPSAAGTSPSGHSFFLDSAHIRYTITDVALFEGNWSLNARRTLSSKDVRRVLAQARKRSKRDYVLLALTFNLAALVSEVIHLKVRDFDKAQRSVDIIPLRKATRKRPLPVAISYPVMRDVMALVNKWVRHAYLKQDDWLFSGRTHGCRLLKYPCHGGHLTRRQAQRIFDIAIQKTGLKVRARGIHALRHARLTQIAEHSKDPWLVRDAGRLRSVAHGNAYVQFVKMNKYLRDIGGKL